MAESNGLLNRRTGNRTGGSNPPLSAIFILNENENGERSRKASLHAFVPTKALHLKPQVFFTSSQNSRSLACEVAPGSISLRRGKPFQSLVKSFALLTCEVSSLRE